MSVRGKNKQIFKAKNFKKSVLRASSYIKSYLIFIFFALGLDLISNFLNIFAPIGIKEITDIIGRGMAFTINLNEVARIGTFLILAISVSCFLSYIQGLIMANVTQKICKKMRSDISSKINCLPLRFFDSASFGDLISRTTNDVDTIGQTLTQSFNPLLSSIVSFVAITIIMFWTNAILATTAIISSAIGFCFMSVVVKKSQKYFKNQQKYLGQIDGYIEEIYTGHEIVKLNSKENASKEEFGTINEKLKKSSMKSQFLSGLMMPTMIFVGYLGYVAVCVVGAILVINGAITFGSITAFMFFIIFFTQPLGNIAQATGSLQSCAAACERVFDFIDEEELDDESGKKNILKNVKGDVEFEHVNFSYDGEKVIIKDFSAKIEAQKKVAIVGPTGAGKTTIVNLLMRFYEVDSGDIKVDGVSIKTITRENVHELFGMVLQDTWLFEGTIKENIIYNKENIEDEEVKKACEVVGIDSFIETLPLEYDTILNENINLSAGQKQLLTIARAMVQNAPMLILDEATSLVDTRTEALIQSAMDRLTNNCTSFVIAHRLSTIKNADMIFVMENGDVVEVGKHEELLEKQGVYAKLYNSQFES